MTEKKFIKLWYINTPKNGVFCYYLRVWKQKIARMTSISCELVSKTCIFVV